MPIGVYKRTKKHIESNRLCHLGDKNFNYGKPRNKETKDKIRKKALKQFENGMLESTKKKISRTHIRKRLGVGENNPNWRGGKSFEEYGQDWTDYLKESIRKRDNYICQLCGIHQDELDIKLDVHHKDYNKENLNPNNLISFCRSCHMKTNYNREYWIEYFKAINYLNNYENRQEEFKNVRWDYKTF